MRSFFFNLLTAVLVVTPWMVDGKIIKLEKRWGDKDAGPLRRTTGDGGVVRELADSRDRHDVFSKFSPRIRAASSRGSDNSDQLTSINAIYYIGPVIIGGETFQVIYDTGSNLLWVPSTQCEVQCANRAKFTGAYTDLNESFVLTYGSGTVKGEYVSAPVTLADASLDAFKMGLANSVTFPGFNTGEFDGLLGLAWPGLSRDDVPSLVPSLYKAKQIDENLFSIYLTPDGSGGELSLGEIDQSKYQGNMTWIDLALQQWWTVEFVGISVANQGVVSSDDSIVFASGQSTVNAAILDSGTSLIVGPKNSVEMVMESIQSSSGVDVYYDSRSGIYAVDCSNVEKLPPVTFTLRDTQSVYHYTMPGPAYVIQSLSSNPNVCPLAFQEDSSGTSVSPFWILGDPFLRTFYSVYDYTNSRVGLAPAYPSAGTAIPGSLSGKSSAITIVTASSLVLVLSVAVLL